MRKVQKQAARIAAVVVATGALFASQASASYLYDWTGPSSITDASGDVTKINGSKTEGQDITQAWYALNNGYAFFRMDLAIAPDVNSYADIYGIHITNGSIDLNLNAVKASGSIAYSTTQTGLTFQHSEADPKTLEWKISAADITKLGLNVTNPFTWNAFTKWNGDTADTTSTATTPIPGAIWLLGSGLFGLVAMRRRKENL